jgi:predicted aldo/keto reductase-like oxidoreductase
LGALFKGEGKKYNPVDLALRWLWNRPDTAVVLSGMSSFEQVKQNLEIAEKGTVGNLTAEEQQFIEQLQKGYDESQPIKCTKCAYCTKDCPAGVDIPFNFEAYNNFVSTQALNEHDTGEASFFQLLYGAMTHERRADHCTECGSCESLCPQKLPIRKLLAKTHKALG